MNDDIAIYIRILSPTVGSLAPLLLTSCSAAARPLALRRHRHRLSPPSLLDCSNSLSSSDDSLSRFLLALALAILRPGATAPRNRLLSRPLCHPCLPSPCVPCLQPLWPHRQLPIRYPPDSLIWTHHDHPARLLLFPQQELPVHRLRPSDQRGPRRFTGAPLFWHVRIATSTRKPRATLIIIIIIANSSRSLRTSRVVRRVVYPPRAWINIIQNNTPSNPVYCAS